MRLANSLSRRIIVAFALFGVVLSLFFALLAALTVEGIEVSLVDERLSDVERWALPRAAAGLPVDLPSGLRFHQGEDIPRALRNRPAGVSDVDLDGVGLHVLSGANEHGPYVIVDHESDYEKVELQVYSMFALCFMGFIALAALLGSFVGRRIVQPLRSLSDAVSAGSTTLPLTERSDELGILARALDAHTTQLRAFLDRERFFTGDVSHELRTPLTVIMGAAEILMRDHTGASAQAAVARIYRAAQEATECITVLLMLARAPARATLAPVSFNEVAAREVERYQGMLADKPVKLVLDDTAPLTVRAPSELCSSAIGNLIRNACQYTERGSVVVSVLAHQISVTDSGPGLPAAVRQTLGHGERLAPSSGSAGTGLGLSLVTRICEYLDAELRYEQAEGGGTRFTIVFENEFTPS